MKSYVYFLAVVVLLVMVPSVYAAWTITEEWVVDYTDAQVNACAYNATTDHVLLGAASIPIYNASDGTPTGSSLTMPTGFVGPIFAMTCAEDGAIFAYELWGDVYYWANESATPVALTMTGDALLSPPRCLRAYGSGNDTRIYLTGGSDNAHIQLITTDGTDWTRLNLIDAPAAKSGVFAVPPGFTTVYGLQPWGSDYDPTNTEPTQRQGWPRRFDYTTSWQVNTSFIPEDPNPDPANHMSYCVGGDYIPAEGGDPAFIYVFYYTNGQFWALNADTGAHIAGLDYTIPGFTTYSMNAQVDTTNKKIYYGCRRALSATPSELAEEGVFGCLSYSAGPTPTPTPYEAAVEMDWQIYE